MDSVLSAHPRAKELVALAKERGPESHTQLQDLLTELGLPADTFVPADASRLPRQDDVLIGNTVCPYEIVENVVQIRGAIPFADKLIRQAERVGQWSDSTQISGSGDAYTNENRTSQFQKITEGAFTGLYTELCNRLWEAAGFYRCWSPYVSISPGTNWDIVRYQEGDHFGPHVDSLVHERAQQQRQLAAMVYLNDDFEGGETRFHHPGPDLTIKPEVGKIALFPPFHTHPHEGCPVIQGTKYAVLGWFYP